VGLSVLLLAIDKVALIPAFRQCCTTASSVSVFRLSLDSDFTQDAAIERLRARKMRYFMNFGSSRSFGYYFNPTADQIKTTPYLSDNERAKLLQWDAVNSAAPGASIVSEYVRMMQWLDHGARPDFISVELSRFSLNSSSLWLNDEIKNGIPAAFAIRYAGQMPLPHSSTVVGSRVFALSRYRVGEPTAVSASIWEGLFSQITSNLSAEKVFQQTTPGIPVGQESPVMLMSYNHVASEMRRTMFSHYHVDSNLRRYPFLMLARAKKENIPIVFWNPAAHPVWLDKEKDCDVRDTYNLFLRELKREGGIYIDLSQDKMKCSEFSDPVHMHIHCFPEMAWKKISALESAGALKL